MRKILNFNNFLNENNENISKDILPEYLYHVSPYSKEIEKDFILKAQSFGGGFGGGHTKGVSFFKDIELAKDYQLGMMLAINLSKCNNKEEAILVFNDWSKIQENRIGKDLKDLIRIFKSEWERREVLNEPIMDTIESVRKITHIIASRIDKRLDDPIIIGGMERLKKLNSEDVKIITVRSKEIDCDIIKGTDEGEIRVLCDVQIYKINESLRDKMKPKSDEEILKDLGKLTSKEIFLQSVKYNFLKGLVKLTPKEILLQSVKYNFLKGVEIALEKGVDINVKNKFGNTALIIASDFGYIDIVELLLKYGANINHKNKYDKTALMIASENHNN
jgi:hypothetical protein